MANTVIQLKKSSTPTAQPADLANGEIAINYADGKLFYKDSLGNIQQISGGGNNFSTINAAGTLVVADIQNDILSLTNGNNIEITGDAINDAITITANLKSVYDVANAAFNTANSVASDLTPANNWANTVAVYANNYAGVMANAANAYAASLTPDLTAANNWANTKLSNTSGVVFNGNLTIGTDLTIGNNIYSINSAFFDTTTVVADVTKGQIVWNPDDETFNMGMANDSVLQVGQEVFYRVKNQSGSTINPGTVVMAAGTLGASGRILVTPAISNGTYPSKYLMGIATSTIDNGDDGYVTHFGKVRGLDTSMWSEGDILYANVSVAGGLQNTAPAAPNTKTTVAIVVSKHATTGTLFVRPTYGSKLNEDEMVELNGLTGGDVIQYVSANGRFENRSSLVSAYGVANAGFDKANSANVLAKAAYDYANAIIAGANVSATGPSSPIAGSLWWNTTYGKLLVYYNDGTSSQWVEASPVPTSARVDTSNTNPITPSSGQLWWNSEYGRLFVYYTDDDNTSQWVDTNPATDIVVGNHINVAFNTANAAFGKANTSLQNTDVVLAGNLTSTQSVADRNGDLRNLPLNGQVAAYVLTLADNGKVVSTNNNVTVPNTIFFAGNTISVFNNSAANITISNASSVTMYSAGTANTGNRTLQQRGIATILCVAANTFVITGAGIVP